MLFLVLWNATEQQTANDTNVWRPTNPFSLLFESYNSNSSHSYIPCSFSVTHHVSHSQTDEINNNTNCVCITVCPPPKHPLDFIHLHRVVVVVCRSLIKRNDDGEDRHLYVSIACSKSSMVRLTRDSRWTIVEQHISRDWYIRVDMFGMLS